ncbi:hypothetical protein EG329_004460 [Mollisiaceae sp. DMI_Dod_QoI]|nr:hypothetical protein EG329_004460 [Helotiales sp. DMI_Dod_QoI]
MAQAQPHTYASKSPPGIQVDSGIKQFFEEFYKISDTGTEEAHELYADSFVKDGIIIMGIKIGRGRDEILQIRKGLWEKVASRLHRPLKIFPFGENADEVMLYGTVAYTLKDGRKADIDWSARANMVNDGGKWKLKYYQVYL